MWWLQSTPVYIRGCEYSYRFLLWAKKFRGWGEGGGGGEKERFPRKAWRLSSLLDTINSFVFPRQTQHFLLGKPDKHHFRFLIATDCKYRESICNGKILSFILFFWKDPFDEPFYKNEKSQTTPRKPFPLPE